MILRRIEQHVRDQNWFAVGLDFLIVVIGVFFGIQLGNWNDSRKEDARQLRVLERLHEEVELAVGYFDEIGDDLTEGGELRLRLVNGLTEDDWSGWGQYKDWEIGSALSSVAFLPTPSPRRSALDEFLNGDLYSSLRDDSLRLAIDDYSSKLVWLVGQTNYVRQFPFEPLEYDGVWMERHPFFNRDAGMRVDTDKLKDNPTLLNDFLRAHTLGRAMEIWWRDTEAAALELCQETGRKLSKPCVPGGGRDEDEPKGKQAQAE